MEQIKQAADIIVRSDNQQQCDNRALTEIPPFNYRSKRPFYVIYREHVALVTQYFKDENCCLLPTFNTINMMYLCHDSEYYRKVAEHFTLTNAYTLITNLHLSFKDQYLQDYMDTIVNQIQSQLKDLLNCQAITMEQYQQMIGDERYSVQFNSISFLPDTRLEIVPFRPRIIDVSGPTTCIAQYLHSLLYSFYHLATQSTTFHTGSDVVQELENYTNNGFLQSTTRFVMIDVKDFEITFDHEQVMIIFERFLHDHVCNRQIKGLSFQTILSLVRLILQMQYFVYDNKLYHQTKGGAVGLPITKLLVNIYLFYWQQDLTDVLLPRGEIFGRNYTQLFFTWNRSKRRLLTLLTMIKSKNQTVSMDFSIGSSFRFLDVKIAHNHGILRTKIDRSCLTEPYTLSYTTNIASEYYVQMIRTVLIQAIYCCTNVRDFFNEYRFLYIICLFNRFPLDIIDTCAHEFFREFNPSKLDYHYSQHTYEKLRQHVKATSRFCILSRNNKRS